jgi:hypothetical protein
MVKTDVKVCDPEFSHRFHGVGNRAARSNIFCLLCASSGREKKIVYAFQTSHKLPLCDAVALTDLEEVRHKAGNLTLLGKQILCTNFKHQLHYSVTFRDERFFFFFQYASVDGN